MGWWFAGREERREQDRDRRYGQRRERRERFRERVRLLRRRIREAEPVTEEEIRNLETITQDERDEELRMSPWMLVSNSVFMFFASLFPDQNQLI